MSVQAALAKEVAVPVECDNRFLSLLGDNADLDLAFLDVEDGIPPVSLGEDLLVLPIVRHGSPAVHSVEEHLDVEGRLLPCLRHDEIHLRGDELIF